MAIQTRKKRKSALQLWIMLALIIAILVVLALPFGEHNEPAQEQATEQTEEPTDVYAATTLVKEGMEAPDFTVQMFDGKQITLSNERGKVVLVNFWATWCPPCREELTRVGSDLIERFKGQNFLFLPISRGEEREAVADFRTQMGYTFPMGLDPERKIYDLYASNYIPRNFLINEEGKVVMTSIGYTAEEFDALIAKIESLLQAQQEVNKQ